MLQFATQYDESINFNVGGYFRDHLRRTPFDTLRTEADLMSSPLANGRIRAAAETVTRFEVDAQARARGVDDFRLGANLVQFALGFSLSSPRRGRAQQLLSAFAKEELPLVPAAETALAQRRAELELITQAQTDLVSIAPIVSIMTEARDDAHFAKVGIAATALELNRLFIKGRF